MSWRSVSAICVLVAMTWLAHAADITFLDPGWKEESSAHAAAKFTRSTDGVIVEAKRGRSISLNRTISLDGDDDQPLVLSCALASQGDKALVKAPIALLVNWPDAKIIVGTTQLSGDRRYGLTAWKNGTEVGKALDKTELDPGAYLNYARVVITTHTVVISMSEDGIAWHRLVDLERTGGMLGAPMQVSVGAGWGGESNLDRTVDAEPIDPKREDKNPVCIYRFAQPVISKLSPHIPASLLATYKSGESREDTFDKIIAASFPTTWWVSGPFAPRKGVSIYGPENAPFDPTKPVVMEKQTLPWAEMSIGQEIHQRVIQVNSRDKKDADRIFFATTVIESSQEERVHLLYDGKESVALFVNGQPVSADRQSRSGGSAELDRHSALVDFHPGRNVVTLRMTSDRAGACAFILRREPGDIRYRIALQRRLAVDFPQDPSESATGLMEAAKLWVDLGHRKAGIAQLDELLKMDDLSSDQREEALLEQARLYARLRDTAGIDEAIATIREFWKSDRGADTATVLRRSAELWDHLGERSKALAELAKATSVEDISDERRLDLQLERNRLLILAGQGDAIPEELAALGGNFPESSEERDLLIRESAAMGAPADLDWMVTHGSAETVRVAVGLARLADNKKMVNKGLQRLCQLPPAGNADDPRVTYAEHLAATGDEKGALVQYQKALSLLGASHEEAKDLSSARRLYLQTLLGGDSNTQSLLSAKPTPTTDLLAYRVLNTWAFIGPFDNKDWITYKNPPVDPEKADGKTKIGDKEWVVPPTSDYAPDGNYDFRRLSQVDNHVMVGYQEIQVSEDIDAEMTLGADDGLIVWVNGKKVYEDRTQRGVTPDSIQVPCPLKKGKNKIQVLVQNGTGGWGIQGHVLNPAMAEQELLAAVGNALANSSERAAVVTGLITASEGVLRFGRSEQATALIPILLAAYPDRARDLAVLARRFADGSQAGKFPELAMAALRWWSAHEAMDFVGDELAPLRMGDNRLWLGSTLLNIGYLGEAKEFLTTTLWRSRDLGVHLQSLRFLGDVMRSIGDPVRAASLFEKVLSIDEVDKGLQKSARDAYDQVRRIRTNIRPITASIDATTAMQTAERALESNDIAPAQRAFQDALNEGIGEVLPQSENLFVGVAWWCARRLRALPPEGQQSYLERYNRDSQQALVAALTRDDVDALEQVARQWPVVGAAGQALLACAGRYFAAGATELAVSTAQFADSHFSYSGDDAKRLKAIASYSAPVAKAVGLPQALLSHASANLPADALHDLRRLVGENGKTVHIVSRPVVANGIAVVHTGVEVVAVDVATGKERWRHQAIAEGSRTDLPFSGMPVHGAVIVDGVVVGRSVAGRQSVIEGRSLDDGRLLWTSAWRDDLPNFVPIGAPGSDGRRILVIGTESERPVLIALRPRDGQLLWRTVLPVSQLDLVVLDSNVQLTPSRILGTPVVSGRSCYILSDAGGIICLDTPTGVVHWVATYPRGTFNGWGSGRLLDDLMQRIPGSIAVGRKTLAALPRDCAGLVGIDRTSGESRWYKSLVSARALAGVGHIGERDILVTHGDTVQGFDLDSGTLLWQWRSPDGPTMGIGSIMGDSVYLSTVGGMHRLNLADGMPQEFVAWRALGIVGTPPGIFETTTDGRFIGGGNAGLSILGAGTPPVKPVPLIPSPLRSSGDLASIDVDSPGAPLGIAWRLGGLQVINFPIARDPVVGETFVRLSSGVINLDPRVGNIRWRIDLPADLRDVSIAGKGMLVVTDGTVGLYSRSNGGPRWILPLNEHITGMVHDPVRLRCSLGEKYAVIYARGQDWYQIRDARTGQLILLDRFRNCGLQWVGERDGALVFVFGQGENELRIDRRDLNDLSNTLSTVKHGAKMRDAQIFEAPGANALLLMGNQNGWIDLATDSFTSTAEATGWNVYSRREGDTVETLIRQGNKAFYVFFDAKTGAVRREEKLAEHWAQPYEWFRYGYGNDGKTWIRTYTGKDQLMYTYGVDAAGNKVFDIPGPKRWEETCIAFLGMDHAVHAFVSKRGRMYLRRYASDGTTASEVPVPIDMPNEIYDIHRVDGVALVGAMNQLVALRPITPGTKPPGNDVASRDLAARTSLKDSLAMTIPKREKAPLIDGHLDDWEGVEEYTAGDAGIRFLGGAALPADFRCRFAWAPEGLAIAAVVDDAEMKASGRGMPPRRIDGLLLALNPRDEGRESEVSWIRCARRDGQTNVWTGGSWANANGSEGGRIQARIARSESATTYEMLVPWGLLRRKEEQRPGDRRSFYLGIAAIDGDGETSNAREIGYNVAQEGGDSWWIYAELAK